MAYNRLLTKIFLVSRNIKGVIEAIAGRNIFSLDCYGEVGVMTFHKNLVKVKMKVVYYGTKK